MATNLASEKCEKAYNEERKKMDFLIRIILWFRRIFGKKKKTDVDYEPKFAN